MLVAFYDESGNDGRSTVFAMAGILMSHRSSYYLAGEWLSLMADFGVGEYKAAAFHRRQGVFGNWENEQCAEFENSIVQLLIKYDIRVSGVSVVKDAYTSAFVDTGFHRRIPPAINKWKKPYLQAFNHVVSDLRIYADHQPAGLRITPVFDRCGEFMGQAAEDYSTRNRDGKLGNMLVSTTRQQVQLQAADFVVWEYRTNLERHLASGEIRISGVMQALQSRVFEAKVWDYKCLDYLRRRVEALLDGLDPETVAFDGCSG